MQSRNGKFSLVSFKIVFWQNWLIFTCLTVMLGFARRNDAARTKVPIRFVFVPIHILYATLLFWGIFNEHMGECTSRTYPNIFTYQYALFFMTYAGFRFLHSKNYFMEWHENVRDMDPENAPVFLSDDDRRRLRVKMIFTAQSERFNCFFTWLIGLTVLAIVIVAYHLKKNHGYSVACSPDGNHWLFADCSARFFVQFLHVFTTMQCAAMARVVFIKTVKKVEENKSFVRFQTQNYSQSEARGESFEREGKQRLIQFHQSPSSSQSQQDSPLVTDQDLKDSDQDDGFTAQPINHDR